VEKARIFVADDDKDFLQLMRELVEEEGYSVLVLREKNKAYEEIKQALPNLVILDVVMEHPDTGWQVLNRLKSDPETAHIPVIICSGDIWAVRPKLQHLLRLGCTTVEKPFDFDTMLSAIQKALALNSGSKPSGEH
jgi:CheY-like chemotaxis protein